MQAYVIPLVIRGRVIDEQDGTFTGRRDGLVFRGPAVHRHLAELVEQSSSRLSDLYRLSFDEILDFLAELGSRLAPDQNPYLRQALELSIRTSGLTEPTLRNCYETLGHFFDRDIVRESVENTIGIANLERWVERPVEGGGRVAVRAFGARAVHVIAGNVPGIAALTIVRNAVTRSDAIVKTPSNDPLTAVAIARTMVDMAPDHPLTRHLSVAYWKGGDGEIEDRLYQPQNIEKIVAWGGLSSISHIVKYLQPGIDLITLDPKLSSTIIGRAAFANEATMRSVAARLALDIGVFNQEACLNARVVYAECGTDEPGLTLADRFGAMVYDAIRALPHHLSTPSRVVGEDLAAELHALRINSAWHKVYGGDTEGGVIVSLIDEPVDFASLLANRVANIVPIDDPSVAVRAVTAYTQTIGIYPESLKTDLRDELALHGAQRLVSLGTAAEPILGAPQDSIEAMRRMCKWIVDESRTVDELRMLRPSPYSHRSAS